MTVKKTPIDRTIAEFWNVVAIPAPAPRWSEGSEFMMAARFGEVNSPMDRPMRRRRRPNQT